MKCSKIIGIILVFSYISQSNGRAIKLLFFLVDGFRWDYFDLSDTQLEGFGRLFRRGSRAEWLVPDFPTNSFPNYKTLETGLHVENHGVTGNYMWDEQTATHFELDLKNPSTFHPTWWDKAESFFITAERQDIRSGLFYVRGCDIKINGITPTHCLPYVDSQRNTTKALKDSLRMMRQDLIDVAYVYHQDVDAMGHYHGPNSQQVKSAVQEVDTHISLILDELEHDMDNVNLMVVSDHGMASIDQLHKLNISNVLEMDDIREITEGGTQAYIWPKPGKDQQVYKSLKSFSKHLNVYYRREIKDRWFFKKHKLVPPIFLSAEKGWYIVHPKSHDRYFEADNKLWHGNHGFDNDDEDMRAIFAATGPGFKKNFVAKAFSNVNIYQVICHVTGIKPHPHNGTWSTVQDMIIQHRQHSDL